MPHVESLAPLKYREALKCEYKQLKSSRKEKIFNSVVSVSRSCMRLSVFRVKFIDFDRWGVTSVSVIQSREISAIGDCNVQ